METPIKVKKDHCHGSHILGVVKKPTSYPETLLSGKNYLPLGLTPLSGITR